MGAIMENSLTWNFVRGVGIPGEDWPIRGNDLTDDKRRWVRLANSCKGMR